MTLSRTTAAPIIAQSDGTLLLDDRLPGFGEAQALLRAIAELRKRPGHLHTYRITPVTVWNAAASGWTAPRALGILRALSRYGVPAPLERDLAAQFAKYGKLRLGVQDGELRLLAKDPALLATVAALKGGVRLDATVRGRRLRGRSSRCPRLAQARTGAGRLPGHRRCRLSKRGSRCRWRCVAPAD
ncbi:helicase-associated domain-containing protein [Cohnella ginsengisoli]|uniref:helicase-associated domain-containing protein n=1 Tax=Cohnella ginsengisoli TaxID=425004 RepID=UPI003B8A745E